MTIKKLVDMSPLRMPDGTIYVGSKTVDIYAVDIDTGRILSTFYNGDFFKAPTISTLTSRILYLGRTGKHLVLLEAILNCAQLTLSFCTEYKVTIFNANTHRTIWNIAYAEWSSASPLDAAQRPAGFGGKFDRNDDYALFSTRDGLVFASSVETGRALWVARLPSVMVSSFDLVEMPLLGSPVHGQQTKAQPAMMRVYNLLRRPSLSHSLARLTRQAVRAVTQVYFGVHNDSFFALSESDFPLINAMSDLAPSAWKASSNIFRPRAGNAVHAHRQAICDSGGASTHDPVCITGDHIVENNPLQEEMDHFFDERARQQNESYDQTTTTGAMAFVLSIAFRVYYGAIVPTVQVSLFLFGLALFWRVVSAVLKFFGFKQAASAWNYLGRQLIFTSRHSVLLVIYFFAYSIRFVYFGVYRYIGLFRRRLYAVYRRNADYLEHFNASFPMPKTPVESVVEAEGRATETNDTENAVEPAENTGDTVDTEPDDARRNEEADEDTVLPTKSRRKRGPRGKKKAADADNPDQSMSINSLEITNEVLGYGSQGTVVYKGSFQGKSVAVKRMLLDFYEIAEREVRLLQQSDDHPNVVRYYCQEKSQKFTFIALELCPFTLADAVESTPGSPAAALLALISPVRLCSQILMGLSHLHKLKIVHRDIKPQNILLSPPRTVLQAGTREAVARASHITGFPAPDEVRVVLSDFGLCKRLDNDQSSFQMTMTGSGAAVATGTTGWRAPEILLSILDARAADEAADSVIAPGKDDDVLVNGRRVTRAVDVFATGCVLYYALTRGKHPFGHKFGRDSNIISGKHDLSEISNLARARNRLANHTPNTNNNSNNVYPVESILESTDLIERMIRPDPAARFV